MESDSERFPGSTYDLTYMCTQTHACTSVCINKHTRKSFFICLFDEHWKQNTGWNVINQINNSEKMLCQARTLTGILWFTENFQAAGSKRTSLIPASSWSCNTCYLLAFTQKDEYWCRFLYVCAMTALERQLLLIASFLAKNMLCRNLIEAEKTLQILSHY